jgi:hypothetical protein
MTILTQDTATTQTWYQTDNPAAWNHTIAANCNLFAVAIVERAGDSATPACTCGGVSMTLIGRAQNSNDAYIHSILFILPNPASGVKSIAITGLGGGYSQGRADAVSYFGPILTYLGAATGAGGSGTAVTFTPYAPGVHILALGVKTANNSFITFTAGTDEVNQSSGNYNVADGNYDMSAGQFSSDVKTDLSETLSAARYWQGVIATFLLGGQVIIWSGQ